LLWLWLLFPKGVSLSPSAGVRDTTRRLVVVTGTSSGLGKATLKALAKRGDSFVICAVRDVDKMRRVAQELGLREDTYAIKELDVRTTMVVSLVCLEAYWFYGR
jgi:NADP-dependent 3-hydroxy acid dehydrogenase YdfG